MIDERFRSGSSAGSSWIETTTRVRVRPPRASISAHPRAGFVGDPDAGLYCHPTDRRRDPPGDALYDTETFGPIVGVGRFRHLDEAMELANGHGYGLSAAIYTTDPLLGVPRSGSGSRPAWCR